MHFSDTATEVNVGDTWIKLGEVEVGGCEKSFV